MGTVDIRITARAETRAAAEKLIAPVEAEVRRRLGEWVFGADEDTLAGIAMGAIAARGWRVALVEAGLGGHAVRSISEGGTVFAGAAVWTEPMGLEALADAVASLRAERGVEVGLGVSLEPGIVPSDSQSTQSSGAAAEAPASTSSVGPAATAAARPPLRIHVALATPEGARSLTLKHGGHARLAPRRAVAAMLDLARRPERVC
jgi:nicotinamide-nucleotide amidase